MSRFLGIDLGTQSLKSIVYDAEQRRVVASASCSLDLHSDADGTREQFAGCWIEGLKKALNQLEPRLRKGIEAIGVSGQQHGFVPLNAAGTVLAPVKLWCDTTTTVECDEISAVFGGQQRCIDSVGNAILPGYTAPKIRWLKKHRPAAYADLATVLLPHDYLNFYLTGERCAERGDASGTGMLDIRTRDWHAGILGAIDGERDLAACLPPLIGAADACGQLLPDVAAILGLAAGIPVACGGGDNMMAALATGNVAPGRLTVSLGTSGTLFAYADRPRIDSAGELAAFCDSTGGWLPLVCTMNCTVATEQGRGLFQKSLAAMEASVRDAPAGSHGVVVLPFFNGERTPNLPNGKGCILGLDLNNTNEANILRASMESAVFGLRAGLEALQRTGQPVLEIRLTGGGAGSAVWRQLIADNLQLPLRRIAAAEGAALGAALNAMLLGSGLHSDRSALTAAVDQHVIFDEAAETVPDVSAVSDYDEYYRRYRRYLEQLQPLFE